ncbi:MAG: DUF1538 domain-containing protein [Oscillospiraceae bacterium]|nr:DUF1538 domain-containing protein [Oscillospiraceae bacterium]
MVKKLLSKFKETAVAVLPVAGIVLLLNFTIAPMPFGVLALFLSGTFLLIIGMTLFQLGSEVGMTPIGNQIGSKLVELKNLKIFLITAFLLGFLVTIAEPDLQVLGKQMPDQTMFTLLGMEMSVGQVLIYMVALGVAIFLTAAVIRVVFGFDLSKLFFFLYIGVFVLAFFTKPEYLAVSFDSGGVTTGPITVPFILALGIGIASVKKGADSETDSFGFVGLCSVGPIMAVAIMGMLAKGDASYDPTVIPEIADWGDVFMVYLRAFPVFFEEVALALSPIIAVYLFFQFVYLKLPKISFIKTLVGVLYTYIGLVIFLTAANTGFMPAGSYMGGTLAVLDFNWVIIPIGMLVGFFILLAEPAVYVLTVQVEEVTSGAITRKMMMIALMIGMSVSVGMAMLRVITGISIWYLLIPGYAIALGLLFFVPKVFTAIAFDSGGVASGPMTATFLLPFATGACTAIGGNVLMDGFGVVAMVAMTPLVAIQILGAVYAVKAKRAKAEAAEEIAELVEDIEEEICEYQLDLEYSIIELDCTR